MPATKTTCPACGVPLAADDAVYCGTCRQTAAQLRRLADADDERASVEAERNPTYAAYLASRAIHRRRLARDRDGQ